MWTVKDILILASPLIALAISSVTIAVCITRPAKRKPEPQDSKIWDFEIPEDSSRDMVICRSEKTGRIVGRNWQ